MHYNASSVTDVFERSGLWRLFGHFPDAWTDRDKLKALPGCVKTVKKGLGQNEELEAVTPGRTS